MSICSGFFRNAAKKGEPIFTGRADFQIPLKATRLWSKARQLVSTLPVRCSSVRQSGAFTTNWFSPQVSTSFSHEVQADKYRGIHAPDHGD
jgi:hypothetical protein